jgi:hypothetical protein
MSCRTPLSLLTGLVLFYAAAATPARGGAVQFQLGEQDFSDGRTPILSSEIRAAGDGETFPFDGTLFGHDVKSDGLGRFEYDHTFDFGGYRPLAATLTIGLIDIDSPPDHPLDTISLSFDGVPQPTASLIGISSKFNPSSVEVVDLPIPIALLDDGMLHVTVAAKRPGYGNLGNAIQPDFSRLVVHTASAVIPGPVPPPIPGPDPSPDPGPQPGPVPGPIIDPGPHPVPIPPTLIPAGVLIALAALPRRRLGRWLRV